MTSPEHPPPPSTTVQPPSPRFPLTPGSQRKVAIAVDLSDESAYAVNWAVQNYLRPDDHVILLHVSPTSFLYGADWGPDDQHHHDFDSLTLTKTHDLAKPLTDANIQYKTHIVKDHDMKERLCLEVERLGLSAVIMGSRGYGSSRRLDKSQSESQRRRRLGSVSDYCVHHCVCPVVVVRFPDGDEKDGDAVAVGSPLRVNGGSDGSLRPVPEEEAEFHDASDKHTDMEKPS